MNNQKITVARQQLADCLEKKSLFKTEERFALLDEIYRRDDHFDADELYTSMLNRRFRVSRATVYNNLELLASCGLVRKHQFGTKKTRYEKTLGCRQHHHLICLDCRKVIEFCDPRLGPIQQEVGDALHFSMHDHELVLYGCCLQTDCEHRVPEPMQGALI